MALTAAERRLQSLLRVLTLAFALATVIYEVSPLLGPFRAFFRQLPFVSNSVVKVSVMGLLCLYAAGDIRRRLGLVTIAIAGHVISIVAMLVLLLTIDTSRAVSLGTATPIRTVLWGAIALDGVITLLVLVFYLRARGGGGSQPAASQHRDTPSGAEGRLRVLALAFGVLFATAAVGYEAGPMLALTRDFFIELPFVTNSVVKVGTLALLCFYVARDVRRNLPLMGVVIVAHVVSVLAQLIFLIATDTSSAVTIGDTVVSVGTVLWATIALDAVVALALFLAYQSAWSESFQLQYYRPI